jgi:hypothetical protein
MQNVAKPGRYDVIATPGHLPKRKLKDRQLIHLLGGILLHHCELI